MVRKNNTHIYGQKEQIKKHMSSMSESKHIQEKKSVFSNATGMTVCEQNS